MRAGSFRVSGLQSFRGARQSVGWIRGAGVAPVRAGMMNEIGRGGRVEKSEEGQGKPAKRLEDLRVFQHARALTKRIYEVSRDGQFSRDYPLRDQIRRAAVSVMANIAEGYERGSNTELVQFLYIAKGSCGELRAHLVVALDQEYVRSEQYESVLELCLQTSGMLSRFIDYLKGTEIRGLKFKRKATVEKPSAPR
jgi:four helix bundle protein